MAEWGVVWAPGDGRGPCAQDPIRYAKSMAGPQAQQTSASRAAQPLLNQTNRVDHRRETLELVTCDDIRRRHIEIAVEEDTADEDSRHIRLKHKPLYRRLFSYIKNAWTGVTFSSGNGNYSSISMPNYKLKVAWGARANRSSVVATLPQNIYQ